MNLRRRGNNAGHTIIYKGETYKLALLPSGVLYPDVRCYIGCGVSSMGAATQLNWFVTATT